MCCVQAPHGEPGCTAQVAGGTPAGPSCSDPARTCQLPTASTRKLNRNALHGTAQRAPEFSSPHTPQLYAGPGNSTLARWAVQPDT